MVQYSPTQALPYPGIRDGVNPASRDFEALALKADGAIAAAAAEAVAAHQAVADERTDRAAAITATEALIDASRDEIEDRLATIANAYDVAREQGYTGTVEEWLESLVGPSGPYGGTEVIDPQIAELVDQDTAVTRAALTRHYLEVSEAPLSPTRFGAVGDGVADDTDALQAAVDAAAGSGGTLRIDHPHLVTREVKVKAGTIIEGSSDGLIRFAHNGNAVRVQGDDVLIRGLTLEGSYAGTNSLPGQRGIDVRPTVDDGTARLRNVTIEAVTVRQAGVVGVRMHWVDSFRVIDSHFEGWGQSAIALSNARSGNVSRNHVYHDGTNPFGSTYGINISSRESDWGAATDPGSGWVDVDGNFVFDTPRSGISNHGCNSVRIRGNTLRRCRTGISGVVISPEVPIPVTGMIVSDNIIDGEHLATTGGGGIWLTGDGVTSGTIVSGNSVIRHVGGSTGGGIYLGDVPGTVVAHNIVRECNGNGIGLVCSGGTTVLGNLIIDPWSEAPGGTPAALYLDNDGESVTYYSLIGNALRRGELETGSPVAVIGARGVKAPDSASIRSHSVGNDWAAAGVAYDDANRHETLVGATDGSGTRVGFYGANPVAKPVVEGSRGGNAALESLLTRLAGLGLISNDTTA